MPKQVNPARFTRLPQVLEQETCHQALGKSQKEKNLQNEVKIVNKIEGEEETGAVALMKDSLHERIHKRIKPCLEIAGAKIENQIFDKYNYTE